MGLETDPARDVVPLGLVTGAHGVKGWVRVHSDTEPREAILDYQPWLLGAGRTEAKVLCGGIRGKRLVAQIEGVNDRDAAEALAGTVIATFRDLLPELGSSEFYWADLIGLKVMGLDGFEFGRIRDMLATGANDVMIVAGDREWLIPFVMKRYVRNVDLGAGVVLVDWDPGY